MCVRVAPGAPLFSSTPFPGPARERVAAWFEWVSECPDAPTVAPVVTAWWAARVRRVGRSVTRPSR
ncbi:hypothetical protein ACFPM0_10165 [Pseudonocardia sulfidoxydans]|uniref:hypothetical protein n=1 Tax=Pseudonocardia sulfidoxydans TaxID=54011 RepID=UPI00361FC6E6